VRACCASRSVRWRRRRDRPCTDVHRCRSYWHQGTANGKVRPNAALRSMHTSGCFRSSGLRVAIPYLWPQLHLSLICRAGLMHTFIIVRGAGSVWLQKVADALVEEFHLDLRRRHGCQARLGVGAADWTTAAKMLLMLGTSAICPRRPA